MALFSGQGFLERLPGSGFYGVGEGPGDARDSRPSSWKGLGRPYLAENVAGSWGKVTPLMFSYSGDGSGHQGKLRRGRDRARARVIFLDFAPPNIKDKTSPGLLHWPSPCLASLR